MIYYDNEDSPFFIGKIYYGDNSGGRALRIEETRVNEPYASDNEVWVVSYNEDLIDDSGGQVELPKYELCYYFSDCDESCIFFPGACYENDEYLNLVSDDLCIADGVSPGGNPTDSGEGINIFLKEMSVKCHKESWIAGKSEVVIALISNNCSGNDFPHWQIGYVPESINGVNYLTPRVEYAGYFSWTFKRDYINNKKNKTINKNLTEYENVYYNCPSYYQGRWCNPESIIKVGWGYRGDELNDTRGDYIYYIIYEKDAIGSKRKCFDACENDFCLDYASLNDAYDYGYMSYYKPENGVFSDEYPCLKSEENSCIKYTFRTKRHEEVITPQ